MPAKKRNAKTEFNLDPELLDLQQKMPKKYKDILEYQARKPNSAPKKKNSTLLSLKEGETMRDFSKRVDEKTRTAINLAHKKTTKTTIKRTENSKLYKKNIKNKNKQDNDVLDELLEKQLAKKDIVKFGEQAMAPPTFTNLPKKKAFMPATRYDDDEAEQRENKMALTAAQKRILESEREKVVAQYRLQKERIKEKTLKK